MTDQVQRPACAVKGILAGGRAMCGRIINAQYCGSSDACEHKVEHKKVTLFAHDCTDGMSRIYVNNESFDYVATVKGQREAARIVSCVSACMGMPDELLTQEAFIRTSTKLTEIATERDTLLALLSEARDHVVRSSDIVCGGFVEEIDAAIASCQGGDA